MVFTNFLCYFSIWFTWLLLFLRIFLNDIAVKSKRKLPNYLIGELLFRKFTRLLFSVPDTVDGVGSSVRLFFFSLHETRYAEFYRVLPNSITTPTTTTSFWQQSCRIQVDQNDRVGNYRSTWQWWSSCPFYFISFAPCSPESGRGLRHLIGFTRVLFTLTFYCVSFVVVLHRSFTGFLPGCVTRLLYILTGWSWNGTWTFFGPPFFLLRISMHVGECVSEEDVALHKRSSRPSRTFVFPLVFFSFVSFHFVQTVFRFVLANRFTALACWDNTHTHTHLLNTRRLLSANHHHRLPIRLLDFTVLVCVNCAAVSFLVPLLLRRPHHHQPPPPPPLAGPLPIDGRATDSAPS